MANRTLRSERNVTVKNEVERIVDRAKYELLAMLVEEKPESESGASLPEWLTAEQLADYWQLRNKQGTLTTAGLLKWIARKPEDFPLPHARMGDLIRFHRTEVDQWAREEATRRGARRSKTPVTDTNSDSKLRHTLTAVG
ncbi:MAG TPA: hypothetical protein VFD48_13530 [Pyrinomonadaceae bacterium]|nr:hypothetical protein [Pyrinomonadaceae bacterium]